MKLTKKQKIEIKKALILEFSKALTISPKIAEFMNSQPCFLGSEKYFEYVAAAVVKSLDTV